MVKGDILRASDRRRIAGLHYIVFLEEDNLTDFVGAMITTSSMGDNIPMDASHFKILDQNGQPFALTFNNSHLVNARLKKFHAWGPFTKVGELTAEGIRFVEAAIGRCIVETWDEYLRRSTI
jgi:hypothetical protein